MAEIGEMPDPPMIDAIDGDSSKIDLLSQQFREVSAENEEMRERGEFLEGEIAELLTEVDNLKGSLEQEKAARHVADQKVLELEHKVEASQNALEDVQVSYPSRNDQSAEIARLRELVADYEREHAEREAKDSRESQHNNLNNGDPSSSSSLAYPSLDDSADHEGSDAAAAVNVPRARVSTEGGDEAPYTSISLDDPSSSSAAVSSSSSSTSTSTTNPFKRVETTSLVDPSHGVMRNSAIKFSLKVGSPEVHGDGTSKYTTYTIETEHPRIQGGAPASVARRYSEFVWLHTRLQKTVRGAIVPPLPEKVMFGRFTDKVVESRCRALELFLSRALGHDQLCEHPDIVGFLCEDKASFDTRKSKKEDSQENDKKAFGDRFREFRISMTNRLSEKSSQKSVEDIQCDKATAYAKELHKVLLKTHKSSLSVVAASRELATNWFNFALAMSELGKTEQVEDSNMGIGEAVLVWSEKADRMSVKINEYADETTLKCEEPLQDYVRLVEALTKMMSKRRECLVTYQTQSHQLNDLQKRYDVIKEDANKQEKALAMQGDLPHDNLYVFHIPKLLYCKYCKLDQKALAAREDLEQVTQSALAEVAQFKEQKARDISRLMAEVINSQMNLAKNIDSTWRSESP